MRTRIALLGVWLAACASARPPFVVPKYHEVYPALAVHVETRDDEQVVSWRLCKGEAGSDPLLAIEVSQVDYSGNGGFREVCSLRARPKVSVTEWRYGDQLPGSTLTNCEPLRPGVTYELSVNTSFVGVVRFKLGEDSTITEWGGLCGP